ncbi:MAG TPA: GNAT family N-acetyltransferase [Phycisphaerales bacterium]|nr:GNAT family N-acetyltransferase [Phycisphaerales bacterium]
MMLPNKFVHSTTRDESVHSVAALTLAFSNDPACRWAWPDAQQYLDAFPRFVRAFGGRAFEQGSAFHTDGYRGVALWLQPGSGPDEEALGELLEETVADETLRDLFHVFERMGAFHPKEPHWHLPLIGVDPALQGRGWGSALLRHALAQCDEENLPAYLEATSIRSAVLYRRLGFAPLGTIQVGSSPPIIPMLREPGSPVN